MHINFCSTQLNHIKNKTLLKSGVVRNAKRLLQSPLGTSIDTNYVAIGTPEQIVNEDKLNFANFLHVTISKLELNLPIKKNLNKDISHSRLLIPKINLASK